jgi:hypothetical protein
VTSFTGEPFDAQLSLALLDFNNEAVVYCKGLSDPSSREYAVSFTRALHNRAKGLESDRFRIPSGLFGPNKGLIEATLLKIYRKHFPNDNRR